jgi:hypothetical protein
VEIVATVHVFAASTGFWAWVVLGDGADRLAGSFLCDLLTWWYTGIEWAAEAVELFGILAWSVTFAWFILRLCAPVLRQS